MKLSKKAITLLKADRALRLQIVLILGISEQAFDKAIVAGAKTLTKLEVIEAIQKKYSLDLEQVITREKQVA